MQVADAADDDFYFQCVVNNILCGHVGHSSHIALAAQARRDLLGKLLHLLEVHLFAEIRLHLILQDLPHIELGAKVVDAVDARPQLLAALLDHRDVRVDLGLCLLRRDAALWLELVEDTAGVRHALDVQRRRVRRCRSRPGQAKKQMPAARPPSRSDSFSFLSYACACSS